MNPATLFLAAYKELGGRPDITAAALHAEADNMYTIWRNCQIGQWATAAHAKHGTNLLKHEEKLLDMVEQVDEEYYGWLASGDVWGEDDDQVWALAWTTAVLRWHHMVHAGRVAEALPASVEEAGKWLESVKLVPAAKVPGQMSLFF